MELTYVDGFFLLPFPPFPFPSLFNNLLLVGRSLDRWLGAVLALGSLAPRTVFEDFPHLLRTSIQNTPRGPRYLLSFHTAAQSSLSHPVQTTIQSTLGQLHGVGGHWAGVQVNLVHHVQDGVRAEREAAEDDERRGGRMWRIEMGDGNEAQNLHTGFIQLARLAHGQATAERVGTFLAMHAPRVATFVDGGFKIEERWGVGEVGWNLSKERGMLEYVGTYIPRSVRWS